MLRGRGKKRQTMGLPRRDPYQHTYADYCTWDDDPRYELIDGVAYMMSPAPAIRHQAVVTEIARQIGNALDGMTCRVFVAPADVLLPKSTEADADTTTVVQPDVFVVCDARKI